MKKFCLFLLFVCSLAGAFILEERCVNMQETSTVSASRQHFLSASSVHQDSYLLFLESTAADVSNAGNPENLSFDYINPGDAAPVQQIISTESKQSRPTFFSKNYLLHIYPSHHFW